MGCKICSPLQQDCGCFYLQSLDGELNLNVDLDRRVPWLKIDFLKISNTKANSLKLSYYQFSKEKEQHEDISLKNLINLVRKIFPQENHSEAINQIQREYPIKSLDRQNRQKKVNFLRKHLFNNSILWQTLSTFPLIYEESKLLAYLRLPFKDVDQLIRTKYGEIKNKLQDINYYFCAIIEFPRNFIEKIEEKDYFITKSFMKGYALLKQNEQENQSKINEIKKNMDKTNKNLYFVWIKYTKSKLSEYFDPGFIGDQQNIFESNEVIFNKNQIFQVSFFNKLQQRQMNVQYGRQSAVYKNFQQQQIRQSLLPLKQKFLMKNILFIQDEKRKSQIQILQNQNDIINSITKIQSNIQKIQDQEIKNNHLLQIARKQRQLGNYQEAIRKFRQISQESTIKQVANLQLGEILFSKKIPGVENVIDNLNLQNLRKINERFYLKGKLLMASQFLRNKNPTEAKNYIQQVLDKIRSQKELTNHTKLTKFYTKHIQIRLEALFLKAKYFISAKNYSQAQNILLQVKYEKLGHHGKGIQLTIIQETLQQLYRLTNQADKLNRQVLYLTEIRQINVAQRHQEEFIRNTNIYHTI